MDRQQLENEIQTQKAMLERIKSLVIEYREKETAAQENLSDLRERLSDALAAYALGETNHSGPEILKAEIKKVEQAIYEAPLIINGLESRAVTISAEIKQLVRDLDLIQAQEIFDACKAEIWELAEQGTQFRSAAGKLRQTAFSLNRVGKRMPSCGK
jgi:chromosome segregation ATPase